VLDIDDDDELDIDTGGTGDSALVISSEGEADTQGMRKSRSRTPPIQMYIASHAGSKVAGLKPSQLRAAAVRKGEGNRLAEASPADNSTSRKSARTKTSDLLENISSAFNPERMAQ